MSTAVLDSPARSGFTHSPDASRPSGQFFVWPTTGPAEYDKQPISRATVPKRERILEPVLSLLCIKSNLKKESLLFQAQPNHDTPAIVS